MTDPPITRVHYVWRIDWYYPAQQYTPQLKAPFTVMPFWNARGDAPQGVLSGGVLTICNPADQHTQCVGIQWPWDVSSADRQRNLQRGSWHGTLLEGKRDKSGFGYARNRYYDPQSGRFTQEDPIGVAGGLNLYGFANGDPVNFSDPFGLCPPELQWDGEACNAWDKWHLEQVRRAVGEGSNGAPPPPVPVKANVAAWLLENALPSSSGQCGNFCRRALEAGGLDMSGRPSIRAGDWGPLFIGLGASPVSTKNYVPQTGDIAVFHITPNHKYGHIQIWVRGQWISDFFQTNFSPYGQEQVPYTIYRFPDE